MNQFTPVEYGVPHRRFERADMAFEAQEEITEDAMEGGIENPALASIAQDVLDATKLSVTAALESPEGPLRGTAEGAFAKAYLARAEKTGRAAEIQKVATGLLDGRAETMQAVFGRAVADPDGSVPSRAKVRDVLGRLEGGIERAVEGMTFKVAPEHLGLRPPEIGIRLDTPGLRMEGGDLVVPGGLLGRQFEGVSDFEGMRDAAGEAEAAAMRDGVIDRALFETMWGEQLDDGDAQEEDAFESVTDRLRLTLVRLHCIDETGGWLAERWNDDRMAIGGVAMDETGDVNRIAERSAGGGYRDGRSRTLNWSYQTFNLREGSGFPKYYGVTFLLAEKDNGGFSSAIQRVWSAVRGAVSAAISKAAAAAGVAIGAFLGLPKVGAIIGKAIAAAVNWILGRLISWIVNAFKDDIFPPQTTRIRIPGFGARWRGGATSSPVLRRRFRGHGGVYDLYYRWSLIP